MSAERVEKIRATVEGLKKAVEADPDSVQSRQKLAYWEGKLAELEERSAKPQVPRMPLQRTIAKRRRSRKAEKEGGAGGREPVPTIMKEEHHGRGEG